MKLKTTLFCIIMLSFFIVSCKQSSDKNTDVNTGDKLSKEEVLQGLEEAVFPLPEPMGVYKMLEDIGASYVGDVLNPVGSVEKYLITNVKAVNLGVYAADLSYAIVYDRKDDIDSYSKLVKKLVDDLSIKVDFKTITSEETKEKAASSDSLIKIATNVFYDMYDFLYKESDPSLAALLVNGYYIEGLYIATHISKETYNNLEMVKIIYDQSKPLDELIKLNNKFSDNQYIQTLQSSLMKLKEFYDSTDGSLTEEQLKSITSTVETIRESMVS
jgi:hypothetical protein